MIYTGMQRPNAWHKEMFYILNAKRCKISRLILKMEKNDVAHYEHAAKKAAKKWQRRKKSRGFSQKRRH